tara:strand:+ start:276 stop:656 length:381 start_codon:yes stop_codon:yes gene_type:complete
MDKKFVLKTFNNHLKEFMDDILTVFPRELDVKTSRTFIIGVMKVKKKLPIDSWYNWVYKPYKEKIDAHDFEFFLNKDYDKDVESNEIVSGIEKIKKKIKLLSDESKKKSLNYVYNLSKLSEMYFTN